jgi:Ran GTPase-activating protein (RanGAP) involved in mRNA processing and transport
MESANRLADSEAYAWVEGLDFHSLQSHEVRDVVDSPLFASPSRLNLSASQLSPQAVLRLLSSDRLQHLRALCLARARLPVNEIEALTGCQPLANLNHLDLTWTSLTARNLRLVARSTHLARLTELRLDGNEIGPEAGRHLASATCASGLRRLLLARNCLRGDGARELARGRFPCLEELGLESNGVTDDGALALCAAALGTLRVLDLGDNHIGAKGLEGLARCGQFGGLRSLILNGNKINKGLDLLDAAHLPRLTDLRLSRNPLGPSGLHGLLRTSSPLLLGQLDLENCDLGPRGAALLAAWPGLASVRVLALKGNTLGIEGARSLVGSKYLGNLRSLGLDCNGLDDEAMGALAHTDNLPSLGQLDLDFNPFSDRGARLLLDSKSLPPRCRISCWVSPDHSRLSFECASALRRRGASDDAN